MGCRKDAAELEARRSKLEAGKQYAGALSLVFALFVSPLSGQDPRFDVMSVRANTSGQTETSTSELPQGRFAATNATLRSLILRAYKLHDSQLIGAPDWIDRERFDVEGRTESPPRGGTAVLMPMLRTLLAERFGLRAHTDMRQLPAYVLTRARRDGTLGPQIRPTESDCSGARIPSPDDIRASVRDGWPPCGMTFVVNFTTKTATGMSVKMRFRRSAITMDDLAPSFQSIVDRPVLNRTGLEGQYDVEYSYAPQPADAGVQSAFGPEAPGVLAAVEEQLGLTLEAGRTDVPVLIVDAVERPSEN